tara:strand:- start:578 stop:883 length:306 start_codon:yes stop_codon:yes gene_type:complete
MRIFVDIDGTICDTPKIDGKWDYESSVPNFSHIEKINKLYKEGNEIVYWTARGSNTGLDWAEFTADQLDGWGCQYHELICGKQKGAFDMVIDDKAKRIEEI